MPQPTTDVSRRRLVLAAAGLALLAHLLLFLPAGPTVHTLAALTVCAFAPGILLIAWLLGAAGYAPGALQVRDSAGPSSSPAIPERSYAPSILEQIILGLGAGYAVLIWGMLLISYVPGGVTRMQVLLLFDTVTAVLLIANWRHLKLPGGLHGNAGDPKSETHNVRHRLGSGALVSALLVLLLAGSLRFAYLGYSEYQGDEARPVARGAAVVQGYEDVLFLHRKGPVEILIPAQVFATVGSVTELEMRLPFAIANLLCLFVVYLLGRQMAGPVAGTVAALLLGVEGYYVGHARFAQYQSIVFLMTALTVYMLHRLVALQEQLGTVPRPVVARHLIAACLFAATGVLAHYDGAIVFLPAAYMAWLLWRRGTLSVRLLLLLLLAGGALLATFYVPFFLHPNFADTYAYYTDDLVGDAPTLYNHLRVFVQRALLYDSALLFAATTGFICLLVARAYWRRQRLWMLAAALLFAMVLAPLVRLATGEAEPFWNVLAMFCTLSLLGLLFLPGMPTWGRMLWIWLALPFVVAIYFTRNPNSHFYLFYMPWMLLSGWLVALAWQRVGARPARRWRAAALWTGLALLLAAAYGYGYWFFVWPQGEVVRHWDDPSLPLRRLLRQTPADGHPLFGFPHNSGWKTVGALYEQGILRGSYATNVRRWVSDWYTRGAEYCEERPDYVFIETLTDTDEQAALFQKLDDRYSLWKTIDIQGEPRLQIYRRGDEDGVAQLDAAEHAAFFDAALANSDLPLTVPAVTPRVQPVDFRFGDDIALIGYHLHEDRARVGGLLHLTLLWRTLKQTPEDYVLFTQVIGPRDRMVGQRDVMPSCDDGPTHDWREGEVTTSHISIPIFDDEQPGIYPLQIGLYHPLTHDRLPIYSGAGEPVGDALRLAEVEVLP